MNDRKMTWDEVVGELVKLRTKHIQLRKALLSLTDAVATEAQYDDVLFKRVGAEIINARAVLQEEK